MNSARLIEKLVAIEQAVGHAPAAQIRVMLADLEDDVLCVDRDMIAALDEVKGLRQAAAQSPRGGGPKLVTPAAEPGNARKKPAQTSESAEAQPTPDLAFVRRRLLAVAL